MPPWAGRGSTPGGQRSRERGPRRLSTLSAPPRQEGLGVGGRQAATRPPQGERPHRRRARG
eukprot:10139626-Alexandrium_andersonii.AAC.1